MSVLPFECDYMEGCHPFILNRLNEINFEKISGYGCDEICKSAKEKIRVACDCPNAEIHFLVGGTQTNATVIDALLKRYETVITANTGHITEHEAGAIEAKGHKVTMLPSHEGKISCDDLLAFLKNYFDDENNAHIVCPGVVYISFPTEFGTIYSLDELKSLRKVCDEYNLKLYLDGARLGYGLSASSDVTLKDIAKYCHAFYIGGTKVGAMFGEAVVITNPALKRDFRYMIKQNGGMLAKGRLLGIQFDVLFTDDLYFKLAKHADDLAMRLKRAFVEKGYELRYDSYTNQQFPILPDAHIEILKEKYSFAIWEKMNATHSAVRFCTSWATKEESVDELIKDLQVL